MTALRRKFVDDLRQRNYAPRTVETYVSRIVGTMRNRQKKLGHHLTLRVKCIAAGPRVIETP